jgi:hypothetical protein
MTLFSDEQTIPLGVFLGYKIYKNRDTAENWGRLEQSNR